MKILVADDDPISQGVLVAALRDLHQVVTARDGEEALSVLAAEAPDLVLLDVMMPGLDGVEVLRRMRRDPALADTPVIFVTAVDSSEGEELGLELGAVDYITKPVNLKLAKLRIRNQLELRRQHQVIREQNEALARQNEEILASMARVKRLEGIIAICMYCKKIRAEDSSWQRLERYFREHSDALFSHGVCPECAVERLKEIDE